MPGRSGPLARTSGSTEAAVLVMARAPRPGEAKARLEPLLGAEGCVRLQRALIARAGRWAASVGAPWIAYAPGDAVEEMRPLAPDGARLIAQDGENAGER